MTDLDNLLVELEKDSKSEAVRFERRQYQIALARQVFEAATIGASTVIDLPTGAGKTNVAILVALMFKSHRLEGNGKVLYIVPTRTLIDQVVRAATWAWTALKRVGISQQLTRNPFGLRAELGRADMIVSTPGILANRLARGSVPLASFRACLDIIIVDEFDEFLVLETSRTKFEARFEERFGQLIDQLGVGLPYCLMSATVPKLPSEQSYSTTEAAYARFFQEVFRPKRVTVPEENYKDYLPSALVRTIRCADSYVSGCDLALNHQIEVALRDYECQFEVKLDKEYLLDRLQEISAGAIQQVLLEHGRWRRVDDDLRKLCRRLLSILNKYVFLHEDMFEGIEPYSKQMPLIVNCSPTNMFRESWFLDDQRDDSSIYRAKPRAKAENILQIVRKHEGKKGVIFTRFVRLSDNLKEHFSTKVTGLVLTLDSRIKSENDRGRVLLDFAAAEGTTILILTRSTGRRGLDIPAADYAVLYSPKREEFVVWQELSRIRSRIGADKPSYILFYSGTSEEDRIRHLVSEMRTSGREYQFEFD